MTKELLKQALDALETNQYAVADAAPHADVMAYNDAITALREALAAQPAAPEECDMADDGGCPTCGEDGGTSCGMPNCGLLQGAAPAVPNTSEVICPNCCTQFRAIPQDVQRLMIDAGFEPPFVAAPVVREPLTDEQIEACIHHVDEDGIGLFAFARAIEQAHGIGGGGK